MDQHERTYSSNLVAFALALRDHGINVSTDDVVSAARALETVDPLDRDQFYYGLKVAIIDEPTQEAVFADLFEEYWDELADEIFEEKSDSDAGEAEVDERVVGDEQPDDEQSQQFDADIPESPDRGESATEDSGDLSDMTEQRGDSHGNQSEDSREIALEIGQQEYSTTPTVRTESRDAIDAELPLLVAELGRVLGTLQGYHRRVQPSGSIDLRRSLDMARQKNPDDFPRVEKRRSQTKVRFFVDVSHSMLQNMDQQFLLSFLFECMRQYTDVRIFLFDVEATEVTHHFQSADLSGTLDEMRRAQTEWGAGTTIGECLADILAMDPFVVDRETVSIVISDGWDAGDLDLLDEQMQTLNRRCESVLWFNPRASSPSYEPKVSGMQTALSYISSLFGFSQIEDLRTLVEQLRSTTSRE